MADGRLCVEGPDGDDVWKRLQQEAGKSDPRYFGYAGARTRFLKFFPGGFASEGYLQGERDYKLAAKRSLDENVPLERALTESGLGEAVLAAYRATNLLSPFEKTRLQDLLRGPAADDFVHAIAGFSECPTGINLSRLEVILRPYDCAKWTVVTYLPYFWSPVDHMFLKPEVTREFAARVGHPFESIYSAKLGLEIYESLLDLREKTEAALQDLSPRDGIDIQSFIWVVGRYEDNSDAQIT